MKKFESLRQARESYKQKQKDRPLHGPAEPSRYDLKIKKKIPKISKPAED